MILQILRTSGAAHASTLLCSWAYIFQWFHDSSEYLVLLLRALLRPMYLLLRLHFPMILQLLGTSGAAFDSTLVTFNFAPELTFFIDCAAPANIRSCSRIHSCHLHLCSSHYTLQRFCSSRERLELFVRALWRPSTQFLSFISQWFYSGCEHPKPLSRATIM